MTKFYERMPELLPETLPDGTIWNWSCRFRLFGLRLRAGSDYYYADRTEELDGKERLPKSSGPWGISAAELDWATIPMPEPAPVEEFRVGEDVVGVTVHSGKEWSGAIVYFSRPPHCMPTAVVQRADGMRSHVRCDSLRRVEGPKTRPGEEERCVGIRGDGCNCAQCAAQAAEDAKADKYAAIRAFDESPQGIALRKREQAKEALDRPLRTGKLGNRDSYGQLLSLRGWETPDDD